MSEQKPAYGIRGGLAHDAGSGSFVLWDNTKCNPLAPAREQARSAWEDGYASAKREWVGLTDDEVWHSNEVMALNAEMGLLMNQIMAIIVWADAKLREKNA